MQEDQGQKPSLEDVLVSGDQLKTVTIKVGEKKSFVVSYRSLSWLDKSACVAVATEFIISETEEPRTMFHIDVYFLEVLKKILVDFPWPISDKVLRNLTPEVGLQLQEIIPQPLSTDEANLVEGSQKPSKGRRQTRLSKDTQ